MTAFVSGAEVLGRYRLERVLGSGGMGEVWSALHLITRKRVALKVLKGEADDVVREDSVKRFFREARAISAVNHPNVVAVHDLFVHEGCPIMVMDLLEGEALSSKLGREGTIELQELARMLVPVISAVGAAHARGIVHRDLKPENIFLALSPSGSVEPKVLDFGIAKLSPAVDAAQTDALTNTGTLLGTPFFMAPEQVFGEKSLDARCDVWAMGVILFLCLSGRRPFDGDNVGQIFKSILTRTPPRLGDLLPNVPEPLSDLVQHMLEKDVALRCPDLLEAFELLARYADVTALSFGPPALSAPPSTMSQPPLRESLPEADAPTEMVPRSGQAAFSALSEDAFGGRAPLPQGRKKLVFAVFGAAVASIATAVLVSQTRHEPAEPTSAAASFESRADDVAKSEGASPEPSVSPAAVDAPSANSAAAIAVVPSAVPAPSSVAHVRASRPRAPTAEAKPAEPAAASSAPAKLPGGILDQERAPF